jgi:serine/threonine-protein kinase
MSSPVTASFGRYEILAEIGRGAMGVVYKARDPKINRLVAIKAISLFGQEPEDEAEYRERFFLEAQAAGRLSHPGIITIFDVGEEPVSHEPYIVMEYVAGQSLSRLLTGQNKKMPLGPGLQIAQELAEALDYAHSRGVIHRDVKPANIMVTTDGHAKIADFGIAKLNQSHMTLPGQVLGSPAYMAPEQLSGEGVDARSDLFSLGVILYSMITGFKPFQGNSAATVCYKVVNREPLPASSLNSDLPAHIDRIVERAMAKDPAQRYQSGAEMAHDIQVLRQADESLKDTSFFKSAVQEQIGFANLRNGSISKRKSQSSSLRLSSFLIKSTEIIDEITTIFSLKPKRFVYAASGVLLATIGLLTYESARFRATNQIGSPASAVAADRSVSISENASKTIKEMVNRAASPDPGDVVSSDAEDAVASSAKKRIVTKTATPVGSAKLHIHIEFPFTTAELSLWMDNAVIYNQALASEPKKHALFHHLEGLDLETMDLAAGEHKLHVRVQSAGDAYDQSRTVTKKFAANGENWLKIVCSKRNDDLQVLIR